ncbi:DUF4157 domain-containing protein [Nodularia spumigena CS-586/05]|uniref:eCIS core domain-containing protein n=1 Tax=Nodularia spumigena TaxID=70799 RepID=UPI00232D9042|nr:DUF4157 domain-containing protein [Nodularia spumigena]MDB9345525.1 DUF4157 domain-containing protein [Nodularia spumigena CS-588/06]MDB9368408.1 DUF4157 domain-containing protein [Nodularia spumigena CS-586/05]
MNRQQVTRNHQQFKNATPLVSGILQRSAVHSPDAESSHYSESNFHQDFSQVPITNTAPVMQAKSNKTGLPDKLKAGIENLSGMVMDNVRVHYNSSKPSQLQALAYTQGTDIHVAPGQEKHLPHEAWHVVQQMQGQVKPTKQIRGLKINDDHGMEREADLMGQFAIHQSMRERTGARIGNALNSSDKKRETEKTKGETIQCYKYEDLNKGNEAVRAESAYKHEVMEKMESYREIVDRMHPEPVGAKMAEGYRVWSENYKNKSEAYLYEGQKASDYTIPFRAYSILGVNTKTESDLEVHKINSDSGVWESTAAEFKTATSANESAVQQSLSEGLEQLAKREALGDKWAQKFKKLVLTVHIDNPDNIFPYTEATWPGWWPRQEQIEDQLLMRCNAIKKATVNGIKTELEINMEYKGKRYARVIYPAREDQDTDMKG